MLVGSEMEQEELQLEIERLRSKLSEAEQTIEAIREGEVDAFAIRRDGGPAVLTLRDADRTYRLLIEEVSEGALTLSSEGRILFCNNYIAEILQCLPDELIGSSLFDYVPLEQHMRLDRLLQEGWSNKTRGEILFRTNDGQIMPMLLSAGMLSMEESKVLGVILTDLSDEKKFEQLHRNNDELESKVAERTKELRFAVKELHRSNQDLEQFAYVASHDLKEPLRMILSFSQLLKKKIYPTADEDTKECLDFVVLGAQRMHALIHDLLAYSRVGRIQTLFQLVDLNDILTMVKHNLNEIITESGAAVRVEKLPVVRGVNSNLVQLFQNLVDNAIKFSGSARPEIRISAEKKGQEWLFAIEDNGIGIDKEHLERIFVIFQRLHSKEEFPGTGIGLSICKKIIDFHGGKIWAESSPGKGTNVFFTLPDPEE